MLPNDGKRAEGLLPRLITGGREVLSSYEKEAFSETKKRIALMHGDQPLTGAQATVLKVLLEPQLAVERSDTFAEDYKITWSRYYIRLDSRPGQIRAELRDRLRVVAQDRNAAVENRVLAWNLLAESHSSATRVILHAGKLADDQRLELTRDEQTNLKWTYGVITNSELAMAELKAARKVWDWHHKFDERSELRPIADRCEERYQSLPLVREFHYLFTWDDDEKQDEFSQEYGKKLAASGADEIFAFLQRSRDYVGGEPEGYRLYKIADVIVENGGANPAVKEFVLRALQRDPKGVESDFASRIVCGWLKKLRDERRDPDLKTQLDELVGAAKSDETIRRLLVLLYSHPHPMSVGVLRRVDFDLVVANSALFAGEHLATYFRLLGGLYHVDWGRFQAEVEKAWAGASLDQIKLCFLNLLDALHLLGLFSDETPAFRLSGEQAQWVISQMLHLPDIDEIHGNFDYKVKGLLKRTGKLPLFWLEGAIKQRIEQFGEMARQEELRRTVSVLPTLNKLSALVGPLTAQDVEDPGVRMAAEGLLELNDRHDSVGYNLPRYVAEVDPEGVLFPKMVVARVAALAPDTERLMLREWTRYGGQYPESSPAWREIAVAACEKAEALQDEKERWSIYSSLTPDMEGARSHPAGEMDPWPMQQVEAAEHALAHETDERLIGFRRWRLEAAKERYEWELAQFEEEQGE